MREFTAMHRLPLDQRTKMIMNLTKKKKLLKRSLVLGRFRNRQKMLSATFVTKFRGASMPRKTRVVRS